MRIIAYLLISCLTLAMAAGCTAIIPPQAGMSIIPSSPGKATSHATESSHKPSDDGKTAAHKADDEDDTIHTLISVSAGEPAYIDPELILHAEMAYSKIIGLYRDFVSDNGEVDDKIEAMQAAMTNELYIDDEEQLYQLGNSLAELYDSDCGYAIRDINKDGIPELIIYSQDCYSIYAIYTLVDGDPALVGAFWSGRICSVSKDGNVYILGSIGPWERASRMYTLIPGSAELKSIAFILHGSTTYHNSYTQEAGLSFVSIRD